MSHVFRFQLTDSQGEELTMIDAESKSVEDARAVLEWQFGPRVVSVRQVEPNATAEDDA